MLPKSLLMQPPIRTPLWFSTARKAVKNYLKCFIQDNHFRINKHVAQINLLHKELRQIIPDHFRELTASVQEKVEITRINKQQQLNNKFDVLYSQQHPNYHNPEWVKNLSSKVTTEKEKLLEKWLNFVVTHTKLDELLFFLGI